MKNNQPKRINKMNNNQPKNNQPKNKNFSIVVSKETLMKLKKIQLQETEKHFENGGESPLTLCETIEILLEKVGR